jgi:hypothetical protein
MRKRRMRNVSIGDFRRCLRVVAIQKKQRTGRTSVSPITVDPESRRGSSEDHSRMDGKTKFP